MPTRRAEPPSCADIGVLAGGFADLLGNDRLSAVIPYAHEIAETHSLKCIHALNLAGVATFALCMSSYMFVIYAALVSRYGKHIIQPRIDALIKGS